jgi:hypothetical protein
MASGLGQHIGDVFSRSETYKNYFEENFTNMYKVVTNLTTAGDVHYSHSHPGQIVFLYYVNLEWKDGYAGETLFYNNDISEVIGTSNFTPGRCVIFDGDIPHTIRAQSSIAPEHRFTISVMFNKDSSGFRTGRGVPTSTVQFFDGCLPRETCGAIIEAYETYESHAEGTNFSKLEEGGGLVVDTTKRSSKELQLRMSDLLPNFGEKGLELKKDVFMAMDEVIKKYNNSMLGYLDAVVDWEVNQVDILKYEAGKGQYLTHIDTDGGTHLNRIFSMLIYLNDVDLGGETEFPIQNIKVKPTRGRICIFPSNFAYPHTALIPRSNDKYVIVAWAGAITKS